MSWHSNHSYSDDEDSEGQYNGSYLSEGHARADETLKHLVRGPNYCVHPPEDDCRSDEQAGSLVKPIPTSRKIRVGAMNHPKDEMDIMTSKREISPRDNETDDDYDKADRTRLGRNDRRRHYDSNQDSIDFPLRSIAAGVADNTVSIRDARALEMFAKRNLKLLKADLQIAQLDVAEAKLAEFSAKLQARQVKIHERHAKLCKRRAILKQAEDDQSALERKLDDEEEHHRDRARRLKNRERRVKQEETGLRIREATLDKRETDVSRGIERIKRWREIVDEKERVYKDMEEILERKQEMQGDSKRTSGLFSSFTKRNKKNELKHNNDMDVSTNKQDIIGKIISGIRKHQIIDQQAVSLRGLNEKASNVGRSGQSEIKSGAPSIWL